MDERVALANARKRVAVSDVCRSYARKNLLGSLTRRSLPTNNHAERMLRPTVMPRPD
jgi:hypothetical protein